MGLFDFLTGSEGSSDYQAATQQLIDRINREWQLPEYDQTPLTPQEYTLLNQYAPQVAAFVQQQAPQLLTNINGPGEQAQQQALNEYKQLAKSGTDPGMQAELEQANISANQGLRSSRANALQALSNRGLGSSGATLNSDIAAGLGAAEQQRESSLKAASEAAQRKAQAIQGLGSLGSQVAGQEQNQQQYNATALNNYNTQLANRRQQYNEYAAGTQNAANQYNQQQAQNVSNSNVGVNNQFNQYNRNRQDTNTNNLTNSENQRLQTEAGLQSGLNQQKYQSAQQSGANTARLLGAIGGGVGGAFIGGPMGALAGAGIGSNLLGGGGVGGAIPFGYNAPAASTASSPNQYAPDTGQGSNYTGGGYVTDPWAVNPDSAIA